MILPEYGILLTYELMISSSVQVQRIGPSHQAGSDSLLTCATFFKMRQLFFENNIDDAKYLGVLYGLGQGATAAPVPWLTDTTGGDP